MKDAELIPTPSSSRAGNDINLRTAGSREPHWKPNKLGWYVAESLEADRRCWCPPTSAVATMDGRITEGMAERYRRDHEGNLLEQVADTVFPADSDAVGVFPTPTASEHKFRISGDTQASKCLSALARRGNLTNQDNAPDLVKKDLRLHGLWVSRLMGFPDGWLDVDVAAPADEIDARWDGDPLSAFDDRWEDGVPRVAVGEPHRTAKLRALGNAVVPQVPFIIMSAIAEQMRQETTNE